MTLDNGSGGRLLSDADGEGVMEVKKNEKKFARSDGRVPKAIQMVLTDLTKDQEKTIVNQSYCI